MQFDVASTRSLCAMNSGFSGSKESAFRAHIIFHMRRPSTFERRHQRKNASGKTQDTGKAKGGFNVGSSFPIVLNTSSDSNLGPWGNVQLNVKRAGQLRRNHLTIRKGLRTHFLRRVLAPRQGIQGCPSVLGLSRRAGASLLGQPFFTVKCQLFPAGKYAHRRISV
jgi:hypothetical protein